MLMLLSTPAMALDVIVGDRDSANLRCIAPTQYTDNSDIPVGDLTIHLYENGQRVQSSATCFFTVPTTTIGSRTYYVTAESAQYGTESGPSNTEQLNVLERQTPNAPTQLNWE